MTVTSSQMTGAPGQLLSSTDWGSALLRRSRNWHRTNEWNLALASLAVSLRAMKPLMKVRTTETAQRRRSALRFARNRRT